MCIKGDDPGQASDESDEEESLETTDGKELHHVDEYLLPPPMSRHWKPLTTYLLVRSEWKFKEREARNFITLFNLNATYTSILRCF